MSYPATTKVFPLNIPIGGVDFVSPLANMNPNYSPWMTNFIPESQYLRFRPGVQIHCTPDAAGRPITGIGTYRNGSTNKLFAYVQGASVNNIYDVSTSTPSLSHALASKVADDARGFNFGGVLGFSAETSANAESVYYNGSWNDMDFTFGGSVIGARIATYFKGRVYLFDSIYLYYTDATITAPSGALSSACNRVDLSEMFSGDRSVQWAAPISSPGENTENTYLAFGNTDGEILVYGGDYPDASNWQMLGRFKTSPPMGTNTILEYRNDIWIFTLTGVVSVRDLFTKGSRAAQDLTVSWRIDPYWVKLMAGANLYNNVPRVSGAFWPEENKVFILAQNAAGIDGSAQANRLTLFVYNCATEAWGICQVHSVTYSYYAHSLTYFNNNLYFAVDGVVMTLAKTSLLDEIFNSPGDKGVIDGEIYSAYSQLGSTHKYKRVYGFEPVAYLGDYTYFKMQAAADFGRKTSAQQTYSIVAAEEDKYHIPFMSVGIEGNYIQWRLAVETHADSAARACELYSMGVAAANV